LLWLATAVMATNAGGVAVAHPEYDSSSPPDGAQLEAPPSEISITFTEPPSSGSSLTVIDPCGATAGEGSPVIDDRVMTMALDSEVAGAYTVRYAVVSTLDGHPVRGSFSFSVTEGEGCAGGAAQSPGEVSAQAGERAAPPQPEPIPWDTFAVGLLLAALIGAAVGKIYAGIVGLSGSR
jgi:methionine-rich copper-binding protein CopC